MRCERNSVNHRLPSVPRAIANGAGSADAEVADEGGGGAGGTFESGGTGLGVTAAGNGGGLRAPQPAIASARKVVAAIVIARKATLREPGKNTGNIVMLDEVRSHRFTGS